MARMIRALVSILVLQGSIQIAHCSCAFPTDIIGDWEGPEKGNVTFSSTQLSGYEISAGSSLVFDCHVYNLGYYVLRSGDFTVFGNANVLNAVFCIKLTAITTDSYQYYVVTSVLPNTVDDRVQYVLSSSTSVSVGSACDDTSVENTPQNVKIFVKYGSAASAKQQCPDVILGQYFYHSSGTCTQSFWDVCTDLTTMTFDSALCSVTQAYSTGGTVYCMYSTTVSGTTVVYVYNTDAIVDSSTNYRFTCMVMTQSGTIVSVSQVPNTCESTQTSTSVTGTGLTVTLEPSITCIPSSTSSTTVAGTIVTTTPSSITTTAAAAAGEEVAESNVAVIAGVAVVLIALIAVGAIIGYCIYTKKMKMVDPSKAREKSTISLTVKSDGGRDAATPSALNLNSSHGHQSQTSPRSSPPPRPPPPQISLPQSPPSSPDAMEIIRRTGDVVVLSRRSTIYEDKIGPFTFLPGTPRSKDTPNNSSNKKETSDNSAKTNGLLAFLPATPRTKGKTHEASKSKKDTAQTPRETSNKHRNKGQKEKHLQQPNTPRSKDPKTHASEVKSLKVITVNHKAKEKKTMSTVDVSNKKEPDVQSSKSSQLASPENKPASDSYNSVTIVNEGVTNTDTNTRTNTTNSHQENHEGMTNTDTTTNTNISKSHQENIHSNDIKMLDETNPNAPVQQETKEHAQSENLVTRNVPPNTIEPHPVNPNVEKTESRLSLVTDEDKEKSNGETSTHIENRTDITTYVQHKPKTPLKVHFKEEKDEIPPRSISIQKCYTPKLDLDLDEEDALSAASNDDAKEEPIESEPLFNSDNNSLDEGRYGPLVEHEDDDNFFASSLTVVIPKMTTERDDTSDIQSAFDKENGKNGIETNKLDTTGQISNGGANGTGDGDGDDVDEDDDEDDDDDDETGDDDDDEDVHGEIQRDNDALVMPGYDLVIAAPPKAHTFIIKGSTHSGFEKIIEEPIKKSKAAQATTDKFRYISLASGFVQQKNGKLKQRKSEKKRKKKLQEIINSFYADADADKKEVLQPVSPLNIVDV